MQKGGSYQCDLAYKLVRRSRCRYGITDNSTSFLILYSFSFLVTALLSAIDELVITTVFLT